MQYLVTRRSYDYGESYDVEICDSLDQVMEYIKQYADAYYIKDFQVYKVNKLVMTFTVESEEDESK